MIYLDNAATTPICDAAKKAIIEHFDDFGNPSSSNQVGHKALMLIEDARERIAKCINAEPDEIYFTSGGSEANTWALHRRSAWASSIEHHSIYSLRLYTTINNSGIVSVNDLEQIVRKPIGYKLDIISCMAVNNEIGTIQPIKNLAHMSHHNGYLFHTDAVQAMAYMPIDVKDIKCDMLSASGHKFGAPKGTGFLYIRNGLHMNPLIYGGKQERLLRGGTENVLGIIAMAAALEDTIEHMDERNKYIKSLRDDLMFNLIKDDGITINGSINPNERVPSNINIQINGVKGDDVVAMCDQYGICISAGSACNEGVAKPSHVLKAIGLTDEEALSSIRITLGHQNTPEEINYVCDILPKIIQRLRKIT